MERALSGSVDSRASLHTVSSINAAQLAARLESYESGGKKSISDVRRTFCLFVTFDLLFITLLWIIELNVDGGIEKQLSKEVLYYDYHSSFFDIFVLAVFRFTLLILAYAVCKLRHWWAIAITTAVTSAFLIVKVIISKLLTQGAFGYLLPIMSFVLAWIETWFLDFKVLPQETEDENRFQSVLDASERAVLIQPGPLSDGQFYSPPESVAVFPRRTMCGASRHETITTLICSVIQSPVALKHFFTEQTGTGVDVDSMSGSYKSLLLP